MGRKHSKQQKQFERSTERSMWTQEFDELPDTDSAISANSTTTDSFREFRAQAFTRRRSAHHGSILFHRKMSYLDDVDRGANRIDPCDFDYPFENIVFQGGGNKGLAYVGVVQYLEEHDLLYTKNNKSPTAKIKRFAGASAGALTAAMVALGYTSDEIYNFLSNQIDKIFLDHAWGYCSLVPNMVRYFGWNPGIRIYEWLGERIRAKSQTSNPDMTFYDLYKERGVELCVVVTNLNMMKADFCHTKTTPAMAIRDALRASIAIPFMFGAWRLDSYNSGQEDIYVDGGVLCNFPVHCFDGWFLSMKRKDAFVARFKNLSDLPRLSANWFKDDRARRNSSALNYKTIGCLVFDDNESGMLRFKLENRVGALTPKEPSRKTALFLKKEQNISDKEHETTVSAVQAFLGALDYHNKTDWVHILKDELRNTLKDKVRFPQNHAETLFGTEGLNVDKIFKKLDCNGDGKVSFLELLAFIESKGVKMQDRLLGYGARREVNTLSEFALTLLDTMLINMERVYIKDMDIHRTIGINTGHVGSHDWDMELEDREFVVQRGYNATETFFRYFAFEQPCHVSKKTISIHNLPDISRLCKVHDSSTTLVQPKLLRRVFGVFQRYIFRQKKDKMKDPVDDRKSVNFSESVNFESRADSILTAYTFTPRGAQSTRDQTYPGGFRSRSRSV